MTRGDQFLKRLFNTKTLPIVLDPSPAREPVETLTEIMLVNRQKSDDPEGQARAVARGVAAGEEVLTTDDQPPDEIEVAEQQVMAEAIAGWFAAFVEDDQQ